MSDSDFFRDIAAILVKTAGFSSDSPDVVRLLRMADEPTVSDRLERMAGACSAIGSDLGDQSTTLLRNGDSGHVDMARLSLIFHGLSAVLQAGADPVKP